jgi:hypothetical protein
LLELLVVVHVGVGFHHNAIHLLDYSKYRPGRSVANILQKDSGAAGRIKLRRVTSDLIERRPHLFFFTKKVVTARKGQPWLGFTNGITRTIWLLANGAKVFPVECALKKSDELQDLTGVPGGRLVVLSELIPTRPR